MCLCSVCWGGSLRRDVTQSFYGVAVAVVLECRDCWLSREKHLRKMSTSISVSLSVIVN